MKSSDLTLSIIIPNYNKGEFIARTLDSVLNQTRLPDEIIIVDDHSTDQSKNIIKQYAAQYDFIKPFFLDENKGVQNARNIGIKKAVYKYICFVDSDDIYIRDDCIEKQMEKVAPNKLVGVYQLSIDANDKIIGFPINKNIKNKYKKHPIYWLYLMENFFAWPWHYIVSKEQVENVNSFDNPYSLFEDSEMVIKLILNQVHPVWVDIEGKGYRINTNAQNLSNRPINELMEAKQYIWDKYYKSLPLRTKIYRWLVLFKHKTKIILKKLT